MSSSIDIKYTIVFNVVKRCQKQHTPWLSAIHAQLAVVGWTMEMVDEVLHDLVEAEMITEHHDPNGVSWYLVY